MCPSHLVLLPPPPKVSYVFFLWHEGKFWPRSAQNFSIKLVYILFLINSELIDDIAMQILITSVAEVLIKHYIIYCSVAMFLRIYKYRSNSPP